MNDLKSLDEALEYLNSDEVEHEGVIISILTGIAAFILANILLVVILVIAGQKQQKFSEAVKNNPKFRKLFNEMMDNVTKFLKDNEYKKYSKYFIYNKNYDDLLDRNDTYIDKKSKDEKTIKCYPVKINMDKMFKDITGTTIKSHFNKDETGEYSPDDDFIELEEFPKVKKAINEIEDYYNSLNKKINKEIPNNHIKIEVYNIGEIWPDMPKGGGYGIGISFRIRDIDIDKLPEEYKQKVEEYIK